MTDDNSKKCVMAPPANPLPDPDDDPPIWPLNKRETFAAIAMHGLIVARVPVEDLEEASFIIADSMMLESRQPRTT